MNSEQKKAYAMRISQANNVEMIIVSYEIINTYLEDALGSENDAEYQSALDMASRCVEEMQANLHYEYEPAKSLKQLYIYVKNLIRDGKYSKDTEAVKRAEKIMGDLHDSYVKIKDEDNSLPLMQNTQAVMVGMTYGKNKILDELSNECGNRGFRV